MRRTNIIIYLLVILFLNSCSTTNIIKKQEKTMIDKVFWVIYNVPENYTRSGKISCFAEFEIQFEGALVPGDITEAGFYKKNYYSNSISIENNIDYEKKIINIKKNKFHGQSDKWGLYDTFFIGDTVFWFRTKNGELITKHVMLNPPGGALEASNFNLVYNENYEGGSIIYSNEVAKKNYDLLKGVELLKRPIIEQAELVKQTLRVSFVVDDKRVDKVGIWFFDKNLRSISNLLILNVTKDFIISFSESNGKYDVKLNLADIHFNDQVKPIDVYGFYLFSADGNQYNTIETWDYFSISDSYIIN